jgi:hypothetical protein
VTQVRYKNRIDSFKIIRQMPLRKLTIESLEQRCPLDATGLAGAFEPIVPIHSDPIGLIGPVPMITCFPGDAVLTPPSESQGSDTDPFADPEGQRPVGIMQPPNIPPGSGGPLEPSSQEPGTAIGPQQPNEPEIPGLNQDPLVFGPRPELHRFATPQQPTDTIDVVPHPHGVRNGLPVAATGSKSTRLGQQQFVSDNENGRLQLRPRSAISLSNTRYFEPSEEPIGTLSDNLQDHRSRLHAFAGYEELGETAITVGDTPTLEDNDNAMAHRHSPVHSIDADSRHTNRLGELTEAQDLALIAMANMVDANQSLRPTEGSEACSEQNVICQGMSSAAAASLCAASDDRATATSARWFAEGGFISSLSRLALVGLLLSNRDFYLPHFGVRPSRWMALMKKLRFI